MIASFAIQYWIDDIEARSIIIFYQILEKLEINIQFNIRLDITIISYYSNKKV